MTKRIEWLSAYIYLAPSPTRERMDRVITSLLGPFVERQLGRGTIDQYFFIRYRERGPHVRLRLHGDEEILEHQVKAELEDCIRRNLSSSEAGTPSPPFEAPAAASSLNALWWVPYEPEVERYGGPFAITQAEGVFHASSELSRRVLEGRAATDLELRFGGGLAAMIVMLAAAAVGRAHGASIARIHRDQWAIAAGHQAPPDQVIRRFEAQFVANPGYTEMIEDLWAAATDGRDTLPDEFQAFGDALDAPMGTLTRLVATGKILDRGRPTASWADATALLLPSYFHMSNNRLGIAPHEEGLLSHLIFRTLSRERANGSRITAPALPTNAPSSANDWVDQSRRIGTLLLATAHHDVDGYLTWRRGCGESRQPVADGGLLNGRVGEAMFFSALAAVTGDESFRDAAVSCCGRLLAAGDDRTLRRQIIDEAALGAHGLGGILYGLTFVGNAVQDDRFIVTADAFASQITTEDIRRDSELDVFWGTGGLLSGLLAVERSGSTRAKAIALAAADHLLMKREVDPSSGFRAWRTIGDRPWSGFAHGSSGIASALLALSAIQDAGYADAAYEAFAFERTLRREDGEWLDHADYTSNMSSWCHGAPGIALARLTAVEVAGEATPPEVLSDLESALSRTINAPFVRPDSLCCGTIGRLLVVLRAGKILENPALVQQGNDMLSNALARVIDDRYAVRAPEMEHMGPGLWQGLAGIGYTLLHAASPGAWPCILSFS